MTKNFVQGKILIAMPDMSDPRFKNSVILICSHNKEGAMGLVVNKPLKKIKKNKLFSEFNFKAKSKKENKEILDIFLGGPVDITKGFVLHSSDYNETETVLLSKEISLTGSIKILEHINQSNTPKEKIILFGYSNWDSGQLESEIVENSWLVSDINYKFLFECLPSNKWDESFKQLGIENSSFIMSGGNA